MSINKKYNYVGSEEIRLSASDFPIGTKICSIADLQKWIDNNCDRQTIAARLVVATFVIDLNGNLRLADRHSEHIACAGGEAVLSAGEIFISWDNTGF
ncbi:MAG: hypothetical protein KME17_15130 [Cyanosarcina radialis HA8281-LM2]|jgi:hypothetical protein|nr:hypothetical protein [Cyanosarcina radialis HA8281-LM2]